MSAKTLYEFFANFETTMLVKERFGPARSAQRMKIKYFLKMKNETSLRGNGSSGLIDV
ncbi:MAG: hypothetical protein ACE3JK_01055 [Sporolactobacillus sp.]